MHNKVIRAAIWITRISLGLSIVIYALLLAIVIYWHIDPEAVDQWYITQPFQAGSSSFNLQKSPAAQGWTFSTIGSPIIYWLIFRSSLFFALIYFALKKVLKLLSSVRDLKTFHETNVRHFKQLAFLGLIYSLVYSFNFGLVQSEFIFNLKLPFEPLMLTAACWVLAAIFEEGKRLREDANSII